MNMSELLIQLLIVGTLAGAIIATITAINIELGGRA